jgi:hypothetical protein
MLNSITAAGKKGQPFACKVKIIYDIFTSFFPGGGGEKGEYQRI